MKMVNEKKIKTLYNVSNRKTRYITAAFAVHADGAFLNGAGIDKRGENRNVSTVKSYWRNKTPVPYVSAQAWRRWLRNTLIEETEWDQSEIEPVMLSEKETSNKIAGKLDPLSYQEDDIFGYMFTVPKKKKDTKIDRRLPEIQLVRNSTLKTSILHGLPDLAQITTDEGFVHLREGTPLPYSTEFYSAELGAVFSLELYRIGIFVNIDNGKNEIDPYLIKNTDLLEIIDHPTITKGKVYKRKELEKHQDLLAGELIKAISKLRGGSKLAQFGADVSPKFLIIAGMKVGGMIFDNLIIPEAGKPSINILALKEIIEDYMDKFTSKIYIGIREGYLTNQEELRTLKIKGIEIFHGTPISVSQKFAEDLE